MATTKRAGKPGTAIATWDERLAKYAQAATTQEDTVAGGHQWFGTKSGQLTFDDSLIVGNQMACIILDSIADRTFYKNDYDPEDNQPPTCFAVAHVGEDEEGNPYPELAPHEIVFEKGQAQSEVCETCQWNQWGSADRGKGKACKERRRLALIPAGKLTKQGEFTLEPDMAELSRASLAYLRIPVTSVMGYAGYVKQLARTLRKPPFAVATLIRLVPDAKNQFRIEFEALEELPEAYLGPIFEKYCQAKDDITFPYSLEAREPAVAPRGNGAKRKPATKQAARPAPKAAVRAAPAAKPLPARTAKLGARKY